jgi:hypothetical protein
MNQYLLMPNKGQWIIVAAMTHEMAYASESNWYNSNTKIAVMDLKTKETKIFSRELDKNGNLIENILHETIEFDKRTGRVY